MKLNVTGGLVRAFEKTFKDLNVYFDVDGALYDIHELECHYIDEECEVSRIIRYPDLADITDSGLIDRLNAVQRENQLKYDLKYRLRKRFSFDGMSENLTHFLNKYGTY